MPKECQPMKIAPRRKAPKGKRKKNLKWIRARRSRKSHKSNKIKHKCPYKPRTEINRQNMGIFLTLFKTFNIDRLAKHHKFVQRSTAVISGMVFLMTLVLSSLSPQMQTLELQIDTLSKYMNIKVSKQAFSAKLNTRAGGWFVKKILTLVMRSKIEDEIKDRYKHLQTFFSEVCLEDCSSVKIGEWVDPKFKKNGGGSVKSNVKIHYAFNLLNLRSNIIDLYKGNTADQGLSGKIIPKLKKGALILRDLGFFNINDFRKISDKLAFFISRFKYKTLVFLEKDDETPVDIHKFLENGTRNGAVLDIPVYIGKQKLPVRLIANKAPKVVTVDRVEKHRKEQKKAPSKGHRLWMKYSVYVTNIPSDTIAINEINSGIFGEDLNKLVAQGICATSIIEIYKARWQVELLFKNLKSNLKIDVIGGANRNRIYTLIYARLIVALVIGVIFLEVSKKTKFEVSLDRLTKWLLRHGRLENLFATGRLRELLSEIEEDLRPVVKQRRHRKTTQEQVENGLSPRVTSASAA
jgi:hypothetical protein